MTTTPTEQLPTHSIGSHTWTVATRGEWTLYFSTHFGLAVGVTYNYEPNLLGTMFRHINVWIGPVSLGLQQSRAVEDAR